MANAGHLKLPVSLQRKPSSNPLHHFLILTSSVAAVDAGWMSYSGADVPVYPLTTRRGLFYAGGRCLRKTTLLQHAVQPRDFRQT